MKPFSKYAALSGKPVVTREGLKVLYITEIPLDVQYPIVAFIEGHKSADGYTSDGKFLSHTTAHHLDLFMATEKKEGWIAFGTDNRGGNPICLIGFATHVWPTEEKAKSSFLQVNGTDAVVNTVKVYWED
jgi:hypothetical protein